MRLWTRNGYDWSSRYPRIVEAALRHRPEFFVLDGEAVLLGVDGIADFNGLHSRKHDDEVQLYACDVLMSAGDDLRLLPLHLRKNQLAKMLRRVDGIILNDFEQGEIGPDMFRHAAWLGLEGLVSKHRNPALPQRPLAAGSRSRKGSIPRFRSRDINHAPAVSEAAHRPVGEILGWPCA